MRTLNLQTQLLHQPRSVVRAQYSAKLLRCNALAPSSSHVVSASVRHQIARPLAVRVQQRAARKASALQVQAAAATDKPVILVSEKLGSAGLDLLNQFGVADCSYDLTPQQLCDKIKDVDALIVRSATKVTREVFEASNGRLKVVGRAGVGIDNVDLQAATEYGCLVVNAPTANTIAAAEHGIALICALSRNVAQADASVKRGEWKRSQYTGVSLVGKTLAIMGFGKVGSEVARRARGLGMICIAHDPFASEAKAAAIGVRLVSLNEALGQGDFFSLHMPLTATTKGMFNDDAFSKIKKGARVINVARGGVIDDAALARALDAKQVAQAALDVFNQEPPPADSPLVNRPDVVCTPHLGASTKEAQEGVAVEIADAVIGALKGELAATAVNAPMVPAEVLAELQPFVSLSQGLGTAAVQLVADSGFTDIKITYASPRGDDLDTRLLRAMVIKGILEEITTNTVNLVNADLLAKTRGLRIIESIVPAEGRDVLSSMTVALGTSKSKFSAAVNSDSDISVSGTVKGGTPYLTAVGNFDVDLAIEGTVLLVLQKDRPGLIAAVGQELASADVNISFMTVSRTKPGKEAVMAIGVDGQPPQSVLDKIPSISGIKEFTLFDSPKFTTTFGVDASYTGQTMAMYDRAPRRIPEALQTLLNAVAEATGTDFNFVLMNFYQDGTHSISYHSDDEKFLGLNPTIASLSLGGSRDFLMKHKDDGKKKEKFPLESGDMLVMQGTTQSKWLHSIPKRTSSVQPRVNITFRKAMNAAGTNNYYKYNVGDGGVYRMINGKMTQTGTV